MAAIGELEEWKTLVKSPGWLRFVSYAKRLYVEDLHVQLRAATNDKDDVVALNRIRQFATAKEAIERLLAYPEEQIAKQDPVKHPAPLPSYSRRGDL